MSFMTKYRPRKLADVAGQEWAKDVVGKFLASPRRYQGRAWILEGEWGCGKTSLARIIGKSLACTAPLPDGHACLSCPSCLDVDREQSPNYSEVDAASRSGVEAMRRMLSELDLAPVGGSRCRTTVLDEAHGLSTEAQTLLLKTLENPPARTHLILVTTERQRMLPTILSRCLHLPVEIVPVAEVVAYLRRICEAEGVEYEEEALRKLASIKEGHVRDAVVELETAAMFGAVNESTIAAKMAKIGASREVADALLLEDEAAMNSALKALARRHSAKEVWGGIRELLVRAETERSLIVARQDPEVRRVIEGFGPRLVTVARMLVSQGLTFKVDTEASLLVAVSMIKERLGAAKARPEGGIPTVIPKARGGGRSLRNNTLPPLDNPHWRGYAPKPEAAFNAVGGDAAHSVRDQGSEA